MCAFYVKRKTTGSRRKARGYIRLCCTGGGNAHLDGCLSKWAHMAESICFRLLFFIYAALHFSTPNCKANSVCPDCIGNAWPTENVCNVKVPFGNMLQRSTVTSTSRHEPLDSEGDLWRCGAECSLIIWTLVGYFGTSNLVWFGQPFAPKLSFWMASWSWNEGLVLRHLFRVHQSAASGKRLKRSIGIWSRVDMVAQNIGNWLKAVYMALCHSNKAYEM